MVCVEPYVCLWIILLAKDCDCVSTLSLYCCWSVASVQCSVFVLLKHLLVLANIKQQSLYRWCRDRLIFNVHLSFFSVNFPLSFILVWSFIITEPFELKSWYCYNDNIFRRLGKARDCSKSNVVIDSLIRWSSSFPALAPPSPTSSYWCSQSLNRLCCTGVLNF